MAKDDSHDAVTPVDLPTDIRGSYNPLRSRLAPPKGHGRTDSIGATQILSPDATRPLDEDGRTAGGGLDGRGGDTVVASHGLTMATPRDPVPQAPTPTRWHKGMPSPPMAQQGEGKFQLLRPIGQGGFGEVWAALQVSLERTVAVKRLRRPRTQSAQADAQAAELEQMFHEEALTTARLEHPNILPVHDLGLDEDGRLLMAMKKIDGKPWDEQLIQEFKSQPVESYLARHIPILIAMSQAVAFAHSRGVLHRDLKPSQVLLGSFGEVLLADWGMALPLSLIGTLPRAGSRPDLSNSNPAGTPAFMAPEQTEATLDHLGPWTDIYLLGGTLYFLLTLTYPHDAPNSTLAFSLAREGIVVPPAEKVKDRWIPQELADLAMKALAREPQQRVPSADMFRQALEDYLSGADRRRRANLLADEAEELLGDAAGDYEQFSEVENRVDQALVLWPQSERLGLLRRRLLEGYSEAALANDDLMLARVLGGRLEPETQRQELLTKVAGRERQISTHARQRRLAVAASFLLAVLLVFGGFKYALDQRRAKESAEQQRQVAEVKAETAARTTEFLVDLFNVSDPSETRGNSITAREILDAGALRIEQELDGQPEVKATLMDTMGQVYLSLGLYGDSQPLLESALDLRRKTLGEHHPEFVESLLHLGIARRHGGELTAAEPLLRQAVAKSREVEDLPPLQMAATLSSLAMLLKDLGDYDEAEPLYREAVELRRQHYSADDPRLVTALQDLAVFLKDKGDFAAAEPLYREGLAIQRRLWGRDHPSAVATLNNLAMLLRAKGDFAAAEPLLREAETLYRKIHGDEHPYVAMSLNNLALVLKARGDLDGAVVRYRAAIEILRRAVGDDHPFTGLTLSGLADVLVAAGRAEEALPLAQEATAILRQQSGRHWKTATAESVLGGCLAALGRFDEAEPLLVDAHRMIVEALGEGAIDSREAAARVQTFRQLAGQP